MSKLCGIYRFDSRPASPEDEARVRTALNSPGCFTPQTCRQPGLIMGWAAGPDTPGDPGLYQSLYQGLYQSTDRFVCLWDGRIDKPKDFLGQAGLSPDSSDAATVLNIYRRKGVDGLRDVVGDWSLCMWDPSRREIVLASDFAGIRPLYYHCCADGLYWSSSLADLVRWTGIVELDETYIARFLSRGGAVNRTPYAGILPVPAGQAISISPDRIANRVFWNLPIHQETRYRDERQYEERMRELFREGVQARLATGKPTCLELSGGLDSSSIVCMADRIRRESPGGPSLITFSYTYEDSPDEKFFLEVERACNLSACHFPLEEYPAAAADQVGVTPGWWEPRFRKLARRMEAIGSSTLLTGQIGDFIMGNTPDDSSQVTEWLAKGRLAKAARTAYAWGKAMQAPIYPILCTSIRDAWFSWIPPLDKQAALGANPAAMENSLAAGLEDRLAGSERDWLADDLRHAPPWRRARFRAAAELLQSRRLQAPEALQHISYAHPYAHRPLVEFMLTIPAHLVCGPAQPRRLMRRAFEGLLPPAVLRRKSKASYEPMFRTALIPLAAALLKSPGEIQVVERGYVERRSLIGRVERFKQGLDCNQTQLLLILLFEFWLRKGLVPPLPPETAVRPPELAVS